jgi:uncharacterized protein YcfJ
MAVMSKTRFRSSTRVVALTALALLGGLAHAGDWERGRDDRNYQPRHADRYDRGVDYARVLEVTPLVERIRYSEPVEQCWEVDRGAQRSDRVGATLLGGVIGAVVGHQIGGGDGRRLATVAGAVVGGAIGNNAGARNEARRGYDYDQPARYEERCAVHDEARLEERIRAYRVAYRYLGRNYVTELPYDPGARLRVAVDARPL